MSVRLAGAAARGDVGAGHDPPLKVVGKRGGKKVVGMVQVAPNGRVGGDGSKGYPSAPGAGRVGHDTESIDVDVHTCAVESQHAGCGLALIFVGLQCDVGGEVPLVDKGRGALVVSNVDTLPSLVNIDVKQGEIHVLR